MTQPTVDSDKIIMYSTTWCPDCHRAKHFYDQNNIEYVEIDIEKHPETIPIILKVNDGRQSVPTIIYPDGSTLTEPSYRDLAAKHAA